MTKKGIFEKIKIMKGKRVILENALKGGIIGYFILHPLVMFVTNFMHLHVEEGQIHIHTFFKSLPHLWQAFSLTMSPWGLTFTIFGGVVGGYYGNLLNQLGQRMEEIEKLDEKLKVEQKDLENKVIERTTDLNKINKELQLEITERKQAEEGLRLTQFTIDHSSDSIFWTDKDARFVYVNDAVCNSLGYSRKELLSMTVNDIVPNFPKEAFRKRWMEINRRGTFTFESKHRTKDGRILPVEIIANYIKFKDTEYIFAFVHDITERKKAEEEMKKRLMKFKLEDGNLYLVKEKMSSMSFDAFNDLSKVGYMGLVISRTPKDEFKARFEGDFEFLWLAEDGGEKSLQPKLKEIESKIENLDRRSVVLIDRLDYLILKNGFKKTISFIQLFREKAYLTGYVGILSIDPSTLGKRELRLLEKETRAVKLMHLRVSPDLIDVMKLIFEHDNKGVKTSYNDTCIGLGISKPTVRKRIKQLIAADYVVESKKGRKKIVELTEHGRSLLLR